MKKKLKKMHFLFIYFLIMLLASCIAEDNFQIDSINNEIYKTKIVDYFDKLKKVSNSLQLSKIKELENVVNLNSARLYYLRTSEKLIIVDLNKHEGLETTESSKLIFYVNDGKIARSNLVSIVNKASYYDYDKMILSILNMSEDKPNFSGTISFYSLFQDKLLVDEFENGELKVNGILNRNIKKKFISKAKKCTDWYWLTTYSDGSQTVAYAFTECDGGGNECVSYKTGKVMCGGGGGGGDGIGIGTIPSSGPSFPVNPQNKSTYTYTDKEGISTQYEYNSQTNTWVIIEVILPSIVIQNSPEYYYYLIIIYPVHNQKVTGPNGFVYTYEGASGNWVGEPISRSTAGEIEDLIDESLLDPCPKGVMEQLKNTTNTDIANVLAKLGASSLSTVNMVMKPANTYAETQRISKYNYEIRVDRDRNTDGTKLFKATALIHEVIHTYFLSIVDDYNYTPSTALPSFPELFEAYVKKTYPNPSDAQHKEMADRYVDAMASALQEYDANYIIDRQVYKDLAWGGLKDAPIFNKTFPPGSADNIRIINRYKAEGVGRAVDRGTPNQQAPVGKPCN